MYPSQTCTLWLVLAGLVRVRSSQLLNCSTQHWAYHGRLGAALAALLEQPLAESSSPSAVRASGEDSMSRAEMARGSGESSECLSAGAKAFIVALLPLLGAKERVDLQKKAHCVGIEKEGV